MNIELQCCALFIISVIAVMFFNNKKLDLMNRTLFIRALVICFACLILDITSIAFIYQSVYHGFNSTITEWVCRLYIMVLVSQGYMSYEYAAVSILPRVRQSEIMRSIYRIIFVVGEVAIGFSPIHYFMSGRVVYSEGIATYIAYVLAGVYTISTIVISLKYKSVISKRRFVSMFVWQSIWLLAAFIQFFVPGLLVIGFASAFGMVVLYIQLENPSEYVDMSTGAFNMNALSLYVKDRYRYGKKFAFFTAKINYLVESVDYNMSHNVVMRTAKGIAELGPEPVFRLSDDTFGVAYDSGEKMQERMLYLKKRKDAVTDVPATATYMLIPDSSKFVGADEFFKFLHANENTTTEITIADDETVGALRKHGAVKDLITKALMDDRVEVFYQPIFNVKRNCFTVAEALVRIINEDGSIVPPGEFIPVAEENGQIIPLGMRVFDKVCKFLSNGLAQSLGLERVEVNVSAAQFDNENPARFVLDGIYRHGIDPKMINLEITETAAMKNKKMLLSNMAKLIDAGVTFSLDDFGTGMSNFDYLVNMSVENIKFDYSFTQGYFTNDRVKCVFNGMTDIMHDMKLNIVSEGVETEEQLKTMKGIDIEYIQGFYFSKPIPEEEFLDFLREHNHQ